jgi:nucleoside-diphosphate-sugar epimerase
MKVLVIGGTGYIGTRLMALMQARTDCTPIAASRGAGGAGGEDGPGLRLDTRDEAALTQALRGVDAVVNCVAGSAPSIAAGAWALARAVRIARVPAVVHVSSMAVYGDRQGPVTEASPWGRPLGWYARAKQDAERALRTLAHSVEGSTPATRLTVLRPGCVWGPGSALWVGRIARWLAQGRLGDVGEWGDGWTHGVTVDDVCQAIWHAIWQALQTPGDDTASGAVRTFNLAAPDSPRWNDWFTDLALALGHIPVRRIRPLQLRADAWVLGPPLHVARTLMARAGLAHRWPEPISPGLLRLWSSTLQMNARAAGRELKVDWTPYPEARRQCVAWLSEDPVSTGGARPEVPAAARVR